MFAVPGVPGLFLVEAYGVGGVEVEGFMLGWGCLGLDVVFLAEALEDLEVAFGTFQVEP